MERNGILIIKANKLFKIKKMMTSDFLRRQLLAVDEDTSNTSLVELTTQLDTDLNNQRPP